MIENQGLGLDIQSLEDDRESVELEKKVADDMEMW